MTNITSSSIIRYSLFFILILGGFFRFYKLDNGNGYFPHPDEHTVTTAVMQLSFPTQMHPRLFTYGSLITYTIYFTKLLLDFIFNTSFHPLLIGRFYSALLSTLSILLVFQIARFIMDKKWALLPALLLALTPGLMQQAHFATPETFQTFFILLGTFLLLKWLQEKKQSILILLGITLGLSFGTKISSLFWALGVGIFFILIYYRRFRLLVSTGVSLTLIAALTFFLVSPFVFFDFSTFSNITNYERMIASGKLQVFYTRQFIDTIPILFQIEKILPFALGPAIFITSILGFVLTVFKLRKSSEYRLRYLLLLISFIAVFLSNSYLFVKWTRYMAPSLPFLVIFASLFLYYLYPFAKKIIFILTIFIILVSLCWTLAFFSIYTRDDVRLSATKWVRSFISEGSVISVEGANTIDVPLSGNYQLISLSMYNLDDDPGALTTVLQSLSQSEYFIVQSRRVFLNHQRLAKDYPKTNKLYQALFDGRLGYSQIQTIHSYPSLGILGKDWQIADEKAEETWTVFDHPVIRIYQNQKHLTTDQYEQILKL